MKKITTYLISFGFILVSNLFCKAQNQQIRLVQGSLPILRTSFVQDLSPVETNSLITNYTTNTVTGNSTEVGTTEGQLSVSLNGASNYNIP